MILWPAKKKSKFNSNMGKFRENPHKIHAVEELKVTRVRCRRFGWLLQGLQVYLCVDRWRTRPRLPVSQILIGKCPWLPVNCNEFSLHRSHHLVRIFSQNRYFYTIGALTNMIKKIKKKLGENKHAKFYSLVISFFISKYYSIAWTYSSHLA